MRKIALILLALVFTGCKPKAVTTYFCETPNGYVTFDDSDNEVIDHGSYVKVFTESQIFTFTNCTTQKERQ